jgi:hypothetical protein
MAIEKLPDDIFEAPGFRMVRRGRNLELRTHRSPEEQQDLKRRMWESRPEILAEIQSKTKEFLEILHKYTSLDLVANLFLRYGIHNPDKYKESESKLRPHWVEHAAVLELRDPRYEMRFPPLVDGADLERAHALLEKIFVSATWYYLAESANPNLSDSPSRIDELRFSTMLYGMSVRSPAYASQWRDVLFGLFERGSAVERLSSSRKLDLRSALAIIDAIENYMIEALQSRIQQARTTRKDVLDRLKDYKATGVFKGDAHQKELFDRIRNMRAKEAKRCLNYALVEWTRVAPGTILSFTDDRIAELAGVSVERVQAFLSEVSVEFGTTPTDDVLPAPVNILHERPVIRYESGYFCPVPHLLPWSIKPAFERVLSAISNWDAYQKQRSSYLVTTALRYFTDMLPQATTYHGLFYPLDGGQRAELDGLVLFDRYAFLIEAKAGSLGAARRGGKLKIKSQLEALVGDAADQVVRAHNYVRANDTPVFTLEGGCMVTLDKARHCEHVLVTLTLDSLDLFTAEMYQMRDIGVVTTQDLPWCISLTDLRCISEILTRPFELTHYLRWRLSTIEDSSVSGGKDELTWLAVYLKEGPGRPAPPASYNHLVFTSYTDDFDAYFMYKEGTRTIPATRPAQPLPRSLDRLCDALTSESPYGFTEVCECLLDLSFEERRHFAQKLVELAFNETKGRAAAFVSETDSLAVKVVGRNLSKADLDVEASTLRDARGKRALILALTTLPDWHVYGWAIAIVTPPRA